MFSLNVREFFRSAAWNNELETLYMVDVDNDLLALHLHPIDYLNQKTLFSNRLLSWMCP